MRIMAPVDSTPARAGGSSFELICTLKANDLIPVHKYKSRTTGLTVAIAEVEGPVVNGFFCLCTEAHDDDGLPHTLEHLIFLGSEKYPYKGTLDLLANRCLGSGTNAWTDTDHTCYTMITAGSDGFLTLMPIYLDHILYPTLTGERGPFKRPWQSPVPPLEGSCDVLVEFPNDDEDNGMVCVAWRGPSAVKELYKASFLLEKFWNNPANTDSFQDSGFATEVHHITGEGEDAGVVYCEMQGRENTLESLVILEMNRHLYPGHCGYKSQTGGILKNLRESTNNKKVRYRFIKNFSEKKILEVTLKLYLSNALSFLVRIKFSLMEEDIQMCACSLLLKYLTDTSVSPLRKSFVETSDPYASEVGYSLIENSECALYLTFENVPLVKLSDVKLRLNQVLLDVVENEDGLDLERLHNVIQRHILEAMSHMERDPHLSVAFMLVGDCLYGSTKEDLDHRLNQVSDMRLLLSEPKEFWLGLLKRYLVTAPSVVVRGVPSKRKKEELEEEEKKRVEEQRKTLGPDGLSEKEKQLIAATEENEKPPPESLLRGIPIPSMSSIQFHPVARYTSESKVQHSAADLSKLPFRFHLDDVHTNFVYIFVLLDTSGIKPEMRLYLPLLLEMLLESPMEFTAGQGGKWAKGAVDIGDGKILVGHEEVVARLEAETVSVATHLGIEKMARFSCGPFSHTAGLSLQVEPSKYSRGVEWARDILLATKPNAERLRTIAAKMVNDVAQARRKGDKLASALIRGACYSRDSNFHASGLMRQHKFLLQLLTRLNRSASNEHSSDPSTSPLKFATREEAETAVLAELEAVREALICPSRLAVHLAAHVNALSDLGVNIIEPWTKFMNVESPCIEKKLKVTPDWTLMHEWVRGGNPDVTCPGYVLGLGSVESGFFNQCTHSINDYSHPDLPALLLFIQYLTQLEGPMWRQIRGLGLAYSYSIGPRPNEGLLYLTLYRATNVIAAYREAKAIVEAQLMDNATWEEALLESARSSLIFEVIEKEKTIRDVVSNSVESYFKGVGQDYIGRILRLIPKVTVDDLKRVGRTFVSPLFDPKLSVASIVCHSSKVEEISMGFKEMGRTLTVIPSLEKSFLSDW
ncbi:hypothetical protein J437_LFUL003887 [Ladona fulva]|uniref:Peptidase M16 N-terminal domain-containing protein n=1 Tax=Ladona fulva TaxID=123851 RepID=A0A8K0K4V2_LADFU|nr:hypothetical protein J437_LFUL003887 [Ladona fulva]